MTRPRPALSTTSAARTTPSAVSTPTARPPLDQHPADGHPAAHGELRQRPPRREVGHRGVDPDAVGAR